MRSRYAAFVMENAEYLRATWHPTTRPEMIDFDPQQEWLQLKILSHLMDGDVASVEFVARSRLGTAAHVLHEVSRFRRDGGLWFYVGGEFK